jgi:2-iminobutanoate/2-iminopropanoate deaminase
MKTQRNPDSVHAPLAAYSHQIEITGPQRQLVIAGQIGMRADGEVPVEAIDQLAAALDNVERNLEAAGM